MTGMAVHRDRERCSPNTGVPLGLVGQVQAVAIFGTHGNAEVPRTNPHEEVHNLWRHLFGRADKVTLIFSVLVVDQNDDLAGTKIFQNVRYGI